ncbi:hypothetical protein, partial [Streptococcus cristatus]|uniref:hypothetical protein n=1 Tax=Streptococcus cristatus TaxID=45634 RepID=UPI001CA93AE0
NYISISPIHSLVNTFFEIFLSFFQFYFPPPTKSLINQQLKGKGNLSLLPLPYPLYHRAAKVA